MNWVSWKSEIGRANCAIHHVFRCLLERRVRDAARATTRLQATRREAGHLQIEAAADPALATDEIGARHEVVLEVERERVHAAIARRRVGLADEAAAARLHHLERVTVEAVLGGDEQRESLRARARVRVGAREHREHVGAPRERAPRLRAVDHPVAAAAIGATLHARDVAADVGLGHGYADHDLARCDLRQPVRLLLVGAALPGAPW
jgi:hypothetical protein